MSHNTDGNAHISALRNNEISDGDVETAHESEHVTIPNAVVVDTVAEKKARELEIEM